MEGTKYQIRVDQTASEEFRVIECLRHGDPLGITL